jgi:hypothetical protein
LALGIDPDILVGEDIPALTRVDAEREKQVA